MPLIFRADRGKLPKGQISATFSQTDDALPGKLLRWNFRRVVVQVDAKRSKYQSVGTETRDETQTYFEYLMWFFIRPSTGHVRNVLHVNFESSDIAILPFVDGGSCRSMA